MGDQREILTTRQMRAVEDAAMATGVTALALIERAGAAAAARITARWPDPGGIAVVLCGPGHNGADGYVIARHLAGSGWPVRVVTLGPPAGEDARRAAAQWQGEVVPLGAPAMGAGGIGLCIDAMFGTGLSRPLAAELAGLLRGIAAGVPLVAVDILSGICADSGRALGDVPLPQAALTVTFHRPKAGHFLDQGGQLGGVIEVCDIGLEPWQHAAGRCLMAAMPADMAKRSGHKYSHGHALILSGGPGRGGAARLAARAALRVGAGLVTLACPPEAFPENAARLDAVMVQPVADAAEAFGALRDPRINALCLGPGLGHARARALVPGILALRRPTVLDADALGAYADDPRALLDGLHERCVLTPHDGEFARLFPDLARRLRGDAAKGPAWSRLDAARAAAERAGAVVLLKGPDTLIAAPDGQVALSAATGAQAAPWLATAGSGDVLAGMICGLLARGQQPHQAASGAAWLHAQAAREFGPGLIAEDIADVLPAVFRGLGA